MLIKMQFMVILINIDGDVGDLNTATVDNCQQI